MKAILSLIISSALVVSGYSQTRNVLVGTNNTVVQPTNFWSADASNARTGLGLGTAATNSASAFQPSSLALSNLASSNGGALTNLQATNLVGLIPTSNIPSILLTNIGTITISQGGTGATNAANARQNLGSTTVGDAVFIATNAAAARTAIGALATNGDATNLTNFPASLLRTNGSGAGLTNLTAANITGTVALASNVSGTIAISNGGTGATNAGGARTNLGATTIGNALFTATNSTVGKAALDLSPTSNITLNQVDVNTLFVSDGTNGIQFETTDVAAITRTNLGIGAGATNTVGFGKIAFNTSLVIEEPVNDAAIITFQNDTDPVVLNPTFWNDANVRQSLGFSTNLTSFWTATNVVAARTNLGLPLAALTNTNNADFLAAFFGANTNPVLVNTNGEVVSPTNFWQVSPANTRVQISQPVVNATNTATNARNLFLYSLAISTTGVTNTIQLPTNGGTLLGDVATVIHEGPTSSITAVRQAGSGTNIITLNQFQEAVQFIYESGGWRLADNLSYVEPIYFSGTNAAANAAASRTNLGLGATNVLSISNVEIESFTAGISTGFVVPSSGQTLVVAGTNVTTSVPAFFGWDGFGQTAFSAAEARTNIGLPLAALTNTSVTNFQKAIFYTNTAPSNIGGNLGTIAAWIEIVASNGVTYKIPAYTNVP